METVLNGMPALPLTRTGCLPSHQRQVNFVAPWFGNDACPLTSTCEQSLESFASKQHEIQLEEASSWRKLAATIRYGVTAEGRTA